jgi:hypothetical protein
MAALNFPLDLRFKVMAIAQQISVEDAAGQLVWYVKMQAFKLKESVTVFADREQTRPLVQMQADRVIDIGATYEIRDASTHAPLGSLRNQGMRSLFRANYEVMRGGSTLFTIREENPWTKVIDSLLFDIPLVGLLSGYIFHPRYLASSADGREMIRMRKEAAFLEGRYSLERLEQSSEEDEKLLALALLMIVMLERRRG